MTTDRSQQRARITDASYIKHLSYPGKGTHSRYPVYITIVVPTTPFTTSMLPYHLGTGVSPCDGGADPFALPIGGYAAAGGGYPAGGKLYAGPLPRLIG